MLQEEPEEELPVPAPGVSPQQCPVMESRRESQLLQDGVTVTLGSANPSSAATSQIASGAQNSPGVWGVWSLVTSKTVLNYKF